MSQSGDNSVNIKHQLILVGDTFENSFLLGNDNTIFSQLSDLNIRFYTAAVFRNLQLSPVENVLTLIVTDVNCVFQEQAFLTLNKFVIACNEASYANVTISNNPSQKSLVSSISMGFEFLFNQSQLKVLTETFEVNFDGQKLHDAFKDDSKGGK